MDTITYTTRGSVRGTCGQIYSDITEAYDAVEEDHKHCKAQGGYSDRQVVRTDGAPLTDAEGDRIVAYQCYLESLED